MSMALDAIQTDAPAPTTTPRVSPQRPWALGLARRFALRQCQKSFDGVFIRGVDATRALLATRPVIFAVNHVNYWDAFALVLADRALKNADSVVLMDDKNLERLPFFGPLGAMPLSTAGGPQLRRQLAAAATHLAGPGRVLWLFPQGRQRAWHHRPLGFLAGLRLLARHPRAASPLIVPASLAYPWREAPVPSMVLHLHADAAVEADADADEVVVRAEDACASGLDAIDAAADAGAAFGDVVVASRFVDAKDGVGARALRALMRGSSR